MAAKFGLFVDEKHEGSLRYNGYLNFIKDHINHVLLLILILVLQLTELSIVLTLASLLLKTML